MIMKPSQLSICIAAAIAASSAVADDHNTKIFDQVVVSASQNAQSLSEVDGAVTVVDDKEIQRDLTDSVNDLFKYVPSVTTGGGRQANGLINIRGITGNRVLISVDGVKQAKNLDWGSTSSGRNLVDVNTLKQVEVVPGPGSSVYGSDAIGGLVYYKTKEPSDVFTEEGNGFGGASRTFYDESNESFSQTLSFAGRSDNIESLLIYTYRDRSERKTANEHDTTTGESRLSANPTDARDNSVLAKVNIGLTDTQTLKLTAESASAKDDITELSSSYANAFYDDHEKRRRLSAEYIYEESNAAFDELSLKFDVQETNTDQDQRYFNPRFGGDYQYIGQYDENLKAAELKFKKEISSGGTEHELQYGLDFEKTVFEQYRTSSLSGSNRSMPRSESESIAVYLRDRISLGDTGLTVTPGVRFDSYEVTPMPDAAYLASNPGDPAPDTNKDEQVSLRLGATYDVTDSVMLFAQYAQGFKAPDMDQLFANYGRTGAYNFISNADLKPETSDTIEVGVRFDNAATSLEVLAFYNDYENFIEEVSLAFDPSYPYGVFQQQNLSDVTIKGIELKGEFYLSELSDSLSGFSAQAAVAYADGEYSENNQTKPLDSVSPLNGVVGLTYDAPNNQWGSELTITAAKGKSEGDVAASNPFLPGGYGVVDLTAFYNINKDVRLDAGIFNLTDKQYWDWETARRRTNTHNGLARFSQPGRHFRIGLEWKF